MTYRLTPKAKSDLSEIWRYSVDSWGEQRAEFYLRDIDAALQRVAAQPEIAARCDEIRKGYRRYRTGSHVAFLKTNGPWLDVIRILHVSRDFARHL